MKIIDKLYYHALTKTEKTSLETEAPIYSQVVQQEQIELHKLGPHHYETFHNSS